MPFEPASRRLLRGIPVTGRWGDYRCTFVPFQPGLGAEGPGLQTDARRTELAEARLDSRGSLISIDDLGARMLGFQSSREALSVLEGELFADPLSRREAVDSFSAPRRVTVDCRGAGGGTRRCEIYERPVDGGVHLLASPAQPQDPGDDSSSLLCRILDALPNPIFVKDAAHRWLALNDSCCRLIGLPREELLGRSDYDCFPAPQAEVFWAKDDEVLSTGRTSENEELVTDKQGNTHVVLTRKSLHKDGEGRPVLVGVITDITDRKRMEEALRRSRDDLDQRVAARTAELASANARLARDVEERARTEERLRKSEQRFRVLADALPQIVWTAPCSGELDYINTRGGQYAGVSVELGFGRGWLDFLHPDDRARAWETWQRSLFSGDVFECEYRLHRSDGSYRWHLARAVPLANERGETARWFGTCTDIDDQKRAQLALQEEDRRRNDFLAVLAHELRNPLTPVLNAAFLLRRSPQGRPGFDRAVAIIERQVTLMARLIDDLLELSRISRGKIFLRRAPMDLAEAVRSVVEDRREDLSARGLRLEVSLPDGPLWVEADAARIGQAVSNLLENAEKYTDRGGRIRVEVRPEGDSAAVSVADTGVGLSRSDLDRIFSPFVQVGSGPGSKSSGLGLGLALVKTLAELHGGSAQAQSEGPGRGATFTLRLPSSRGPRDCARTAASPSTDREGRPRKILIVEDNPDAAESLRLMLELDRHQVAVASSAEEGLVRARAWHPDVVLSDVGLPGVSGYELARALRADSPTKPHLVAITGYGQTEDRERALRSGFERHVTKPFDHATLEKVLQALDGS